MADSEFDYEGTLEACARGDKGAFQRLYQREAGQMLGLLLPCWGGVIRLRTVCTMRW